VPDPSLRLDRPATVDAFEESAGPFLRAREAENCLMLGLCSQLRAGSATLPVRWPYFGVIREGREVAGAALVAGFLVVLSNPIPDAALPLLVADLERSQPDVPGVVGETNASRQFAEQWARTTGRSHRLNLSERIFRLERVIAPRPVAGAMRPVAEADRELIARWLAAFTTEALGQDVDMARMREFAGRWIAREARAMYFWVVDGEPVSMVGVSGETPNGIRVAPVYTPSDLRGRGYATALTAAVTQKQLDGGKRYCFLFTDLANPTSNHIYRSIGYEPVADASDYRFELPAAP